jgi:Uma2 family endonuclease
MPRVAMASVLTPRHRYSFADYLHVEEVCRVRHEYFDGEIYALPGSTPEHAAVAAAITAILGRQLEGGSCRVYSSDLRVRVLETGLATYPDVTVVCGPSERDPESPTHVTNPKVIVEVLSPSTGDYDRGEKLQHYQRIASLSAVILVDLSTSSIELCSRDGADWKRATFGAGGVLTLEAIRARLAVDEVMSAARSA